MATPLRLGILGAARIAPMALIRPARALPEASVVAVAAREPARAAAFARRHGIPRVHAGYDALLADPDVDAVYNPLPNALHAAWTIRALEAGKHVLCEKPFAASVAEAEAMARAAVAADRVLVEAFHYRYHALFARMREVVDAGTLGRVRRLEAHFWIPLLRRSDIRWRADLAGGALMDTGCYAVHLLRHLAGAEPTVTAARARWTRGGVDRVLEAELTWLDGRTARLSCALLSWRPVRIAAAVVGDAGRLDVANFVLPQLWNRLRVTTVGGTRRERVGGDASYVAQLRAFVGAVRRGEAAPTGPADAIANMRVIEAIHAAAGRRVPGTAAAS
jgi:predicted dehydrogenase